MFLIEQSGAIVNSNIELTFAAQDTSSQAPQSSTFKIPATDKYYYFFKAYLKLKINQILDRDPAIVYQMGRVGSKSVVDSLKQSGLDVPIYHSHFMTPEGLNFLKQIKQAVYGTWRNIPPSSQYHLLQSCFLSQVFSSKTPRAKKYKIVTIVRDPIATNVSGFFHNRALWISDFDPHQETGESYLQELSNRFFQKYPHHFPLTWFDVELKRTLGIDVFASEFPKSKGYKIYRGTTADVLLLKLEKIGECGKEVFQEFFGLKDFKMIRTNTGDSKEYAQLYKQFLKFIKLGDRYIDTMYGSKYAQHFYDASEIEAFQRKWTA